MQTVEYELNPIIVCPTLMLMRDLHENYSHVQIIKVMYTDFNLGFGPTLPFKSLGSLWNVLVF